MIPNTNNSPLIRSDFSDDAVWQAICSDLRKVDPVLRQALEMMKAMNPKMSEHVEDHGLPPLFVDIIDDPQYAGATTEQLLELVPPNTNRSCMYIVDRITISNPDHPVLVVDLQQRGRSFRAIPEEIQPIDNNLSIANMSWEEFADNVQQDGVFRGFEKP